MRCSVAKREFIKNWTPIIDTSKRKKSWTTGVQKPNTGKLAVIMTAATRDRASTKQRMKSIE